MPASMLRTIGWDYDGVLVRTVDFICKMVQLQRPDIGPLDAKMVNRYGFWEDIGLGAEMWRVYDLMDEIPNLRLALEPYDEHVATVLRDIVDGGQWRVDVVTANNPSAQRAIQGWLTLHDLPDVDVVTVGRPPHPEVRGPNDHSNTFADKLALGYDLYIDDNPAVQDASFGLLANARWNERVRDTRTVRRFRSYTEIPGLLDELGEIMDAQEATA